MLRLGEKKKKKLMLSIVLLRGHQQNVAVYNYDCVHCFCDIRSLNHTFNRKTDDLPLENRQKNKHAIIVREQT